MWFDFSATVLTSRHRIHASSQGNPYEGRLATMHLKRTQDILFGVRRSSRLLLNDELSFRRFIIRLQTCWQINVVCHFASSNCTCRIKPNCSLRYRKLCALSALLVFFVFVKTPQRGKMLRLAHQSPHTQRRLHCAHNLGAQFHRCLNCKFLTPRKPRTLC